MVHLGNKPLKKRTQKNADNPRKKTKWPKKKKYNKSPILENAHNIPHIQQVDTGFLKFGFYFCLYPIRRGNPTTMKDFDPIIGRMSTFNQQDLIPSAESCTASCPD